MRILIIAPQFDSEPDIERSVAGPDAEIVISHADLLDDVPDSEFESCDALMVCRSRHIVTAEVVAKLHRCRIVSQAGVGFNHIDLEACAGANIPVCNAPDYGTTEVADHAIAMVLALVRGIVVYDAKLRTREIGWNARNQLTVRRLRDLRFGIVGLGRIGTATALRALSFQTSIGFYDPYLPAGTEKSFGFARADSLEELLSTSDIVSMHVPLNAETENMINGDSLAAAKPGLILANTARGRVVDLDAVHDALKSGLLGGAALDVLPDEPIDYRHPLLKAFETSEQWLDGRLIVTPHAAFFSPDSVVDMRRIATENIVNYLRDGILRSCVNGHLMNPPVHAP